MVTLLGLIALALIFSGGALWAFLSATANGQFDDLETPRHRLLAQDETDGEFVTNPPTAPALAPDAPREA